MEATNTRLFEMERRTVALEGERQQLINGVTVLRCEVGQTASSTCTIDTMVIGKQDHYNGDPTSFSDWSSLFKVYMGTLDSRYQQLFTEAEQSAVPILSATRDPTEATLSGHQYHVSVMLSTDTALDTCHNAGINDGLETWRQYTVEWESKLMSRYVGLLLQFISLQFDGDTFAKLLHVWCVNYEVQSRNTVEDDLKMGVVILGMHDSHVKEHLIRNTALLDSWIKTRDEILEIARTQQYINSQTGSHAQGQGHG